ncbi:MAG: N-(5'-phosphoribosyl)anthranilate isomerase, partial [Anaerolineae bacterium]
MTRLKICGLTNLEDARLALRAGADMLGFIFYEPSPRYIPPAQARDIVLALREEVQRVRFVGVFVNASPDVVRQTLEYCGLDMAQLHGDESPEEVARFDGRAFKALNPRSADETELLAQRFAAPPAP